MINCKGFNMEKLSVCTLVFIVISSLNMAKCQLDVSEYCQNITDIYVDNMETEDIVGSTTAPMGSAINRISECWRVRSLSTATDQLIRITIEGIITKPTEDLLNNTQCTYGLFIMDGLEYDGNNAIAERCSVGQGEQVVNAITPATIYTTRPNAFIRYFNKPADPPELWMQLTTELVSTSQAVQTCFKVTLAEHTLRTLQYHETENFQRDTFECWLIDTLEENNTLQFLVDRSGDKKVGFSDDCSDKLEFFSWNYTDISKINLLKRICVESIETQEINFPDRAIYLRFVTNSVRQRSGFRLDVQTVRKKIPSVAMEPQEPPCVQVPVSPSGVPHFISSPNYPLKYENDLDLCWRVSLIMPWSNATDTIQNSSKFSVNVVAMDFNLNPPEAECTTEDDRIEFVVNENSSNSSEYKCGDYEGNKTLLFTSAETFLIRFRSNQMNASSGFQLALIAEPMNCQEITIDNPTGHTPTKYNLFNGIEVSNQTTNLCWKLYAKPQDFPWFPNGKLTKQAIIVYIEDLQMNEQGNCNTDYLRIYDGQLPVDNSLYSKCGGDPLNATAIELYTSTNFLYIRYGYTASTSTRLSVKSVDTGYIKSIQKDDPDNFDNCVIRIIESDTTELISVTPRISPNGVICETFKPADQGRKIQMKLIYLNITTPVDCAEVLLSFYGDNSTAETPVVNTCTENEAVITAPSYGLSLLARTGYGKLQNVSVSVESVKAAKYVDNCIEVPISNTDDEYMVASPNYPYKYPANIDICWLAYLLKPDPDKRLVFSIMAIDLFSSDECYDDTLGKNDTITIENDKGRSRTSPICGPTHIGSNYCESAQYLTVRFRSDNELATRGFSGYFKAVPKKEVCSSRRDSYFHLLIIILICIGSLLALLLLCACLYCACCGRKRKSKSEVEPQCEICGGPVDGNHKH